MTSLRKKNNHPAVKRLLLWLCIPLLAWYVSSNWYQLMLIQGKSMEPSYHHLQLVVLNKHDQDFQLGDVVAFWCEGFSTVLVKRIAAGPNDRVVIRDETLYVNDQISDVYPEPSFFSYAGMLETEITLGPEEYLLLGDNAAESKDSRYPDVGIVSKTSIYGEVCKLQ